MTTTGPNNQASSTLKPATRNKLTEFGLAARHIETPDAVLDALDDALKGTMWGVGVSMLQTVQPSNISFLEEGKHVFIGRRFPKQLFRTIQFGYSQRTTRDPGISRTSTMSYTIRDLMQSTQLIGGDRWVIEALNKYGIRNVLVVPAIAGVRTLFYFSKQATEPNHEDRCHLHAAALFATLRIHQLAVSYLDAAPIPALTARETAIIRHLAAGSRMAEVAGELGITIDTIRTHLSRAKARLGVKTTTHLVATAIRMRLIS